MSFWRSRSKPTAQQTSKVCFEVYLPYDGVADLSLLARSGRTSNVMGGVCGYR